MTTSGHVLGIDVGSVAVSFVELDPAGLLVTSGYATHHGRIRDALARLLDEDRLRRVHWVAATSSTPAAVARSRSFDPIVASITAARRRHPDLRSLLLVGGERFGLVRFDEQGDYVDWRTNSACAAGTGSFLDQQAQVLGLGDSAALAEAACASCAEPPRIASRCAVFARTDLIHAQQEGYGPAEICRGLCQGLAGIVADTLTSGEDLVGPVVFAGGVARNRAVRAHLEERLGTRLIVDDDAHLYGALGAALLLSSALAKHDVPEMQLASVEDLVAPSSESRPRFHDPLELRGPAAPHVGEERRYEYVPRVVKDAGPVEMDLYASVEAGSALDVYLGIDVGSTSTKAVILDTRSDVIAGAYTRTAGRPIVAAQALFEALDAWRRDARVSLHVLAAGTTGSGRKLVGAVVGADLVVDEISAHARGAYEIDPETDTIIEIGGQDSKFTTLRNGLVTSAVMNTVCAAGTGSFIEEQARRLDVALDEYADLALGSRAPLASSRCTVFMQRDVNQLRASGYTVSEILATVLHSVAENYLEKVAREGSIGRRVAFQGATARNHALVAAFEQRLDRTISVSPYCHLTGALGVSLLLAEEATNGSPFRGLSLYTERVSVRKEVCGLCRNHCKIVAAEVRGETAAYGFLCGRDYDVERFVKNNASGFDLVKARRRALRLRPQPKPARTVTVGLPAGLTMFDELALWRRFFANLRVRVVTSETCDDPVRSGKRLARAEFCAPMAAWHGHLAWLADKVDFVFAPIYLEARSRERGTQRQYCYYSQYASPLSDTISCQGLDGKVVRPLIRNGFADLSTKWALHAALKPILGDDLSLRAVSQAYADALEQQAEGRARWKETMRREVEKSDDVDVVLLGRPYVCLDPAMNKGVPDIFGALGVKAFYMDMLDYDETDVAALADLLEQVHWHYAAKILESAFVVARTPGLYPVLVTSFKCAPDSMIIEFVRRILDQKEKPYLILELDGHDSSVGYETRIEAAVRSFRNHRAARPSETQSERPITPTVTNGLEGRTLFLPSWDRLSCTLMAASLRREGIDAQVIVEDELTVQKGLRKNTGQCVPLHAIVEGFIEAVEQRGLDPAQAALYMTGSKIACNIGMYPAAIRAMLEDRGGGFERSAVLLGDSTFLGISVRAAVNGYFAHMFGGMLRRLTCRVRPYETHPGEADAAAEEGLRIFTEVFEGGRPKLDGVRDVVDRFAAIETGPRARPKVAIFGDVYVRDNEVMNQDLVRVIERHGGEVITTPYSEFIKIAAEPHLQRSSREGKFLSVMVQRSLLATVKMLEREFAAEFSRVLGSFMLRRPRKSPREILAAFGLTDWHDGESVDNLLKLFHIVEGDPDVALFVQANPAFCCPSLVTEAMAGRIRELTGVPLVTVTYDGTVESRNEAIVPYLQLARSRGRVPVLRS